MNVVSGSTLSPSSFQTCNLKIGHQGYKCECVGHPDVGRVNKWRGPALYMYKSGCSHIHQTSQFLMCLNLPLTQTVAPLTPTVQELSDHLDPDLTRHLKNQ